MLLDRTLDLDRHPVIFVLGAATVRKVQQLQKPALVVLIVLLAQGNVLYVTRAINVHLALLFRFFVWEALGAQILLQRAEHALLEITVQSGRQLSYLALLVVTLDLRQVNALFILSKTSSWS